MPTNTFYNLPKDKQEKVLVAAKEEFFRAKDGNILVKNIVLSAGIPRGSFYQYFDSKEDLTDFIIKQHLKSIEERFCKKIDDYNGDILLTFECIFNNIVSENKNCGIEKELKVMEHIKKMQERYGSSKKTVIPPKRMNENVLLEHIDKSKFLISNEQELASVFHIIISMMIKNIVDYQNGLSPEEAKKNFKRDLDYLRYGIIK